MSNIQTYLDYISTKEWASEVRTAIVNAIRECYNNTEDPELRTEALEAAIQAKIDAGQMAALTIGDGTITAAKLANEIITTAKIADGAITQAKLDPNIEFVKVDSTLSKAGEAADAKATGDAIAELNGSLVALDEKIDAFEDDVKLPILYLYGDESEIETNYQNHSKNKMNFRYAFFNPNKKKQKFGWCKLSLQGNSTLSFVKHNYNIQFYKDAGYKTKDKVDYMDLTDDKHPKWTLKSNQNDYSQARNIVSARLWGDVVHCRKGMSDALSDAPNHGAVDGHPVLLYMNNAYYGLYMFNMSKSDWMIGIDEDEPLHCAISSSVGTNSTKWTATGMTGWELEIPDEWQVVPAEEGESENVTARERFIALQNFVINSSDEDFYAHLNDRLDVLSAIDYLIYSFCVCNVDSMNKNQFLVTWNGGKKWTFTAYDMDQTFGAQFASSTPINYDRDLFTTHPNFLMQRLIYNFGAEIVERYAVLRSGALSYDYMARELEIFFSEFPKGAKETDRAKWVVNEFVTISDLESMQTFVRKRLLWCDGYFARMNPDRIACNDLNIEESGITCSIPHEPTPINAIPNPVNTTDPIIWMSSDELVVTVNQNGEVIALADGTATITATCGDHSDTCTVTVDLIHRGTIDYTEDVLEGLTWYDGKIYDDTGTLVDSGTADRSTNKFSLQNCLYSITGGSSVQINIWDENGTFVGRTGGAGTKIINGIEGYQYAIKAYGKKDLQFTPVNHASTQKAFKRFTVQSANGKGSNYFYINDQYKLQELSEYIYNDNGALNYDGVDFAMANVPGVVTFGATATGLKVINGFTLQFLVTSGRLELWLFGDTEFMAEYNTLAKGNEYLAEHPISLYFNIN